MSRTRPNTKQPEKEPFPRVPVVLTGVVLLLAETVFIPGAFSPFRSPKMAVGVAGLAVLAGGALAVGLWRGRLNVPWGRLSAVLLLLPALQAISAIWTPSSELAFQTAAVSAVWVVAMLWIATFSGPERHHLLKWAAGGAAVSAAVLLAQWARIAPFALPGYSDANRFRLTGLAGNPSDLAMAGILMLPLLLPRLLGPGTKRSSWILPALFALTAVLGQTMTGFVSIALVALGMLVLKRSRKAWLVAAALILPGLVLTIATPLRDRVEAKISRLTSGDWYFLLSAREDGWSAAAAMIQGAPITGVGAGNYSREFFPARLSWLEARNEHGVRGELSTHFEWAHNDPLQLTAELGLLGVAWMIAFSVTFIATRSRPDPQLILALLAWTPFLLLHYPTHLAVGLVPATLLLTDRLSTLPMRRVSIKRAVPARILAAGVIVAVFAVCAAALERTRLDLWHGVAEGALGTVESVPAAQRAQLMRAVEYQIGLHMKHHPEAAGWLWRMAGRTRLYAGAYSEAETAFRRGAALEPHEEAEMGLGLALAGQGRMSEALHHLTRACRINITLTDLITQPQLRETVRSRLTGNPTHRPKKPRRRSKDTG